MRLLKDPVDSIGASSWAGGLVAILGLFTSRGASGRSVTRATGAEACHAEDILLVLPPHKLEAWIEGVPVFPLSDDCKGPLYGIMR
jgi:hypothetical protein